MAQNKLTLLFHKELSARCQGPTQVTVISDVRFLKNKNAFAVDLQLPDGPVSYWCENEQCKNAFFGKKGQTFSIIVDGYKESATVTVVGATVAQHQQNAAQQQAPQPQAHAPAPQHQPEPAKPQDPLAAARIHIAQNRGLLVVAMQAAYTAAHECEQWHRAKYGDQSFVVHPTVIIGLVQSCLYGAAMKGIPAANFPVDVKFPDVKPGGAK